MADFNVGDMVVYVGDARDLRGEVGVVTRVDYDCAFPYCRVRVGPKNHILAGCYSLKKVLSSKLIDAAKERKSREKTT